MRLIARAEKERASSASSGVTRAYSSPQYTMSRLESRIHQVLTAFSASIRGQVYPSLVFGSRVVHLELASVVANGEN